MTLKKLTYPDDAKLIEDFISKLNSEKKSFRYFEKRSAEIISNHIFTVVSFSDNGEISGYGHLEPENDKTWLGICVLEKFQGKKIGALIMNSLIDFGKKNGLHRIHLSVDKENVNAQMLYEKVGFEQQKSDLDRPFFIYELSLNEK